MHSTTNENNQNTGSVDAKARWTKILNAVWAFLRKNYAYMIAPLFVGVLYIMALWQGEVYPFGKYTAASYDFSAQICPFIEHLFDVMQGKSSLTYTYALVGGVDVVGTFLYFFVSPFSFLFLLFGDGRVAHASSFVMFFKLCTMAFAGTWFAKKLFKEIPDYLCAAVGVVYTYCGYTFVANTYINWLDFLIYLPFCTGAFKHFVKTENFWPFAILMSACIYTCFSLACFSMFIAFPTLIMYGVFCAEEGKKKKFIAYLCLAFVVAVLAALPVLLPALAAYMRSGRGGGLFDNFWVGYKISDKTGEFLEFNTASFTTSAQTALYRKWSYILADSVFVCLTVIWFCRKGFKEPLSKFMAVAGIFTLLPTLVDEAMLLMNMGSYMSYALRFGHLNALYFLGGACLGLENICFKPACAYDGTPLFNRAKIVTETVEQTEATVEKTSAENTAENGAQNTAETSAKTEKEATVSKTKAKNPFCVSKTQYVVWLTVILLVGIAAAVFLIYYVNNYKTFLLNFTEDDSALTKTLNKFGSSFAHSLGGFETILPIFLVVFVVMAVGGALIYFKRVSPCIVSLLMLVVVGTQVLFYNDTLVLGNRSVQHIELADYHDLCQELNERDGGEYFRVKDFGDEMTAVAPLPGGTNSFSVFSSVIDADNFITHQLFGYQGNGKNSFKSSHNTSKSNRCEEFGDSFLGYKYVMVPKSKLKTANGKNYLKKVMTTDEEGNEVHLSNNSFYVYENTYVFPMAYTLKQGDFTFVSPNEPNSGYRKKNQIALYEFLRDKNLKEFRDHDKVQPSDVKELSEHLWKSAADIEVGQGTIKATVTAQEGEYLFLSFVASKGYTVTVNGKKAELVENDLKFLSVALEEGENEVVFTYSSPYVKYAVVGVAAAIMGLLIVALVMKKTKIVDKCAPVIAWAGIGLAVVVVAVFMIYPTGACIAKLIELFRLTVL